MPENENIGSAPLLIFGRANPFPGVLASLLTISTGFSLPLPLPQSIDSPISSLTPPLFDLPGRSRSRGLSTPLQIEPRLRRSDASQCCGPLPGTRSKRSCALFFATLRPLPRVSVVRNAAK